MRPKDLTNPDDIIAITGWKLSTTPKVTRGGNYKPYTSPLDNFLKEHGVKYYRGGPGLTHRYSRTEVLMLKDKLLYQSLMARQDGEQHTAEHLAELSVHGEVNP